MEDNIHHSPTYYKQDEQASGIEMLVHDYPLEKNVGLTSKLYLQCELESVDCPTKLLYSVISRDVQEDYQSHCHDYRCHFHCGLLVVVKYQI